MPDSTLPAFPDTASIRATQLGAAPLVVAADASARAAVSLVTVSHSQYWPTFSVSYSNGFTGLEAPWTSTWSRAGMRTDVSKGMRGG